MELLREYVVVLGYILLLALVLGAVLSVVAWFISLCFPTGESDRPAPPVTVRGTKFTRDITIGKDQADPVAALRRQDVDIARRDKPQRPITRREIEERRASSYLSRGF